MYMSITTIQYVYNLYAQMLTYTNYVNLYVYMYTQLHIHIYVDNYVDLKYKMLCMFMLYVQVLYTWLYTHLQQTS